MYSKNTSGEKALMIVSRNGIAAWGNGVLEGIYMWNKSGCMTWRHIFLGDIRISLGLEVKLLIWEQTSSRLRLEGAHLNMFLNSFNTWAIEYSWHRSFSSAEKGQVVWKWRCVGTAKTRSTDLLLKEVTLFQNQRRAIGDLILGIFYF